MENTTDAWTNIEFATVAMDGPANGIQGENVNVSDPENTLNALDARHIPLVNFRLTLHHMLLCIRIILR